MSANGEQRRPAAPGANKAGGRFSVAQAGAELGTVHAAVCEVLEQLICQVVAGCSINGTTAMDANLTGSPDLRAPPAMQQIPIRGAAAGLMGQALGLPPGLPMGQVLMAESLQPPAAWPGSQQTTPVQTAAQVQQPPQLPPPGAYSGSQAQPQMQFSQQHPQAPLQVPPHNRATHGEDAANTGMSAGPVQQRHAQAPQVAPPLGQDQLAMQLLALQLQAQQVSQQHLVQQQLPAHERLTHQHLAQLQQPAQNPYVQHQLTQQQPANQHFAGDQQQPVLQPLAQQPPQAQAPGHLQKAQPQPQHAAPFPMPQHYPVQAVLQQTAAPQAQANTAPQQPALQQQAPPHLAAQQQAPPQQVQQQHAPQPVAQQLPTPSVVQHTPQQAQQQMGPPQQVQHQQPPSQSPRRPQVSSPASPAQSGGTPQMTRQAAAPMHGLGQPQRSPTAMYDLRSLGQGAAPLQTGAAAAGVQPPAILRPVHPQPGGISSPQTAAGALALPHAGGGTCKKRIFAVRGSSSTDPVRPTNSFKHLQRHGSEPAGLASLAGGGAAGGVAPLGLAGGGVCASLAPDRLAQLANEWKLQQSLVHLLLDSMVRSAPVVAASRELRRGAPDATASARNALRASAVGESGTAVLPPRVASRPATPSTDLAQMSCAELSEAVCACAPPAPAPSLSLPPVLGGGTMPAPMPIPTSIGWDTAQPPQAVPPYAGAPASSCAGSVGLPPPRGDAPLGVGPRHAVDAERFATLARELLELASENARLRRENMELLRDFRETRLRPQASTPRAVPTGGVPPSAAAVGTMAASLAPPPSTGSEAGVSGLSGINAPPSLRATDVSRAAEVSRATDASRVTDASRGTDASDMSDLSSSTVATEC